MTFEEHGAFKIELVDSLLFVDAQGPFNEELIKRYKADLESKIQALEHASWCQIITLHDMSVFTPEAESALTNTLINRKSRGLIASAVIISDVDYQDLVCSQMSRCYHTARVEHEYFTSLSQAKEWVNERLK